MTYRFASGGATHEVLIERVGEGIRATVEGRSYAVELLGRRDGTLSLRIDGRALTLAWAEAGGILWLATDGKARVFERSRPLAVRRSGGAEGQGQNGLRAAMPAQVIAIETVVGQELRPGQTLLVLEAMKMEMRVVAPAGSWRVARLLVGLGQRVGRDQLLLELEAVQGS